MRAFLLPVLLIALASCKPVPEPTAPIGTPEFFEQQKAICEAQGGSFGSDGKATNVCFLTPKDANQSCSQASDCEGHCLARSRSCAPVVPLLGCHEVLMAGGMPATVCLD